MKKKKQQLGTQVGNSKAQTAPISAEQDKHSNAGTQVGSAAAKTKEQKTTPPQGEVQQNEHTATNAQDSIAAFAQHLQGGQARTASDSGGQQDIAAFGAYMQAKNQMQGLGTDAPQAPRELPPMQDDGKAVGQLLGAKQPIGTEELRAAQQTLTEYLAGKKCFDDQIVQNEEWYRLRHWELLRKEQGGLEPVSGWLFNAIAAKHADAMDNYPTCNVLPRERDDDAVAEVLKQVIPCVLDRNQFQSAYSSSWWQKLKHGTGCYGIFWDKDLEDGMGDIAVRDLDLLKLAWQPNITDIQRSRNLFIVDFIHKDQLAELYPQLDTTQLYNDHQIMRYINDDYADDSNMIPVVDWYYKKLNSTGKPVLHYCKFVSETVLFASENEGGYEDGYYKHGRYPIVTDVMYPMAGTPYGFGIISLAKDNQMYIDRLYKDILENAEIAAKPRYWYDESSGINRDEFLDLSNPLVPVSGRIDDNKLKAIDVPSMPGAVTNILQQKIDELKETTSNRDVNSGSSASGVTAASAISALQEAGNKNSRDIINGGYLAFQEVCTQVLELLRQFYTEERSFRIAGKDGASQFVQFSGAAMADRPMPEAYPGQNAAEGIVTKRPVFDIKIEAEKKNPYQRLSNNTFIMELYGNGFFAPDNAQAALAAIDLMEFEGKEDCKQKLQEGQTLLAVIQQMQMQMQQMQQTIGALSGQGLPQAGGAPDSGGQNRTASDSEGGQQLRAQTANRSAQTSTSKADRIKRGASADMSRGGGGTAVK